MRAISKMLRKVGRRRRSRAVTAGEASVHTISRPAAIAGRIWSRTLAACPWCVPLMAICRMSGMYQMRRLPTLSSSTVFWMRPSSCPKYCWPAIRSAPPASNTLQPPRSSRRPRMRRNDVLPTRVSPLTSSERAGASRAVASASLSASRQASGSSRMSWPLALVQKRPKELRKVRSTLSRCRLSRLSDSRTAMGWCTRSRNALITACWAAEACSIAASIIGGSPKRSRSAKWSRNMGAIKILSRHQSLAWMSGAPTAGRGLQARK